MLHLEIETSHAAAFHLAMKRHTVEPRLSGPRLSGRSIIRTRHNAIYTYK